MIAGEQIGFTLEYEQGEQKLKMPAVLATLLINNGLARHRFKQLSEKHKIKLIQKVTEAKAMKQQLDISMRLLSKTV